MIVLACEGNCEVELMSHLLDSEALSFNRQDILDHRPLYLRQPKSITPILNSLPIEEDILFYRIGDTLTDEFDIGCFGEIRKEHISVIDVCTTPEIEILIIINEKQYQEYIKVKSSKSPKEFVKENIKEHPSFKEYLKNHDIVWAIKEYKRIKKLKDKNDVYLADLLKSNM